MHSHTLNISNKLRTLLYSGTVPGEPGVGGVILKDLYKFVAEDSMPCFAVIRRDPRVKRVAQESTEMCGWIERRYETGYRPVAGVAGELIGSVARRVRLGAQCKNVIQDVVREGRRAKVSQIWAILDSPTVILTAREIARQLDLPLIVLVWDAPELLCSQGNWDRWSTAALLKEFDAVMTFAKRVAVVGETMQSYYEEKFHRTGIILRHGIDRALWKPVSKALQNRSDTSLIIGYAGSITATDAFNAFIAALDKQGWLLGERKVILRMAGTRYLLEPRGPQQIEYFGWRSVEETIEILSEADLLYLPQPFAESLRPLAELSFPTKLSTYLAAGRPVLLHAPSYASVCPFFKRFAFGQLCESLNENDIAKKVLDCVDASATELMHVHEAREQELNAMVFESRFHEFLSSSSLVAGDYSLSDHSGGSHSSTLSDSVLLR